MELAALQPKSQAQRKPCNAEPRHVHFWPNTPNAYLYVSLPKPPGSTAATSAAISGDNRLRWLRWQSDNPWPNTGMAYNATPMCTQTPGTKAATCAAPLPPFLATVG